MRKRRISEPDHLGESGGLNLTPLIDVVFVVLILFIIVAPMLELDRIQLAGAPAREERDKAVVHEGSPLMIHVHADNSIWVNRKIISSENLMAILQALHAKSPKVIPQLFQDKKAQFGTYQTVKNAVEAAGFAELDVILEPVIAK